MHIYFRIPAALVMVSAIVFACTAGDTKTDKQPAVEKKEASTATKQAKKKTKKDTEKKAENNKKSDAVISVDTAHYNAGVFKQGKVKSVKHDFVIKNTGTDTLVIEKVKPG